jgi:hypothetical protein
MKYLLVFAAAVVWTVSGITALAQPKPSPSSNAWELDFDCQPLQAIEVVVPGQGKQKFWFLRYTVTNHNKEDQVFVPEFVLYTDNGDVARGQRGVAPMVYDQIKKTFNDPQLKDQTAMLGKVLQGDDNAKSGVAIFRDFDGIAGEIHIFVGGLSGETAEVELPVAIEVKQVNAKGNTETVNTKKVLLARTLDLKYIFPGNPAARSFRDPLEPKDKTWIMR